MSFFSNASGAAAEIAARTAQRESMKKGKSKEQKKCIDFLFDLPTKGCGCLGKPTITMKEYMDIVNQKLQNINFRERALQKIALDPSQVQEIPPVVFNSFIYDDSCLVRIDDDVAVSSQYSVTWIFFSATQLYTYQYIFDTTSDNTWEITKDFFYSDVTCFITERDVREKIEITNGCILSGESIEKTHYVVDLLKIIVPGASYEFSLRNSGTIEQSIQAAKAMLREKKYQN